MREREKSGYGKEKGGMKRKKRRGWKKVEGKNM